MTKLQRLARRGPGWHLCKKCDGFRTVGRWDCPRCGGSGIKETPAVPTNPRPKE